MDGSYNIFYYGCAKIQNYFPYGDLPNDWLTDPFFQHSNRYYHFASVFNHAGYGAYRSINEMVVFRIHSSRTMGMDHFACLLFLLMLGFCLHYQTPSGGETVDITGVILRP